MDIVRIGIIGYGNMGSHHAQNIFNNVIKGLKLTAICDIDPSKINAAKNIYGESLVYFSDYNELLASNKVDSVIISTPHYFHPEIAIRAIDYKLHVIIEKPAGVYTKQVREMNDAFTNKNLVFGIMYNQRTNPIYTKLKEIIKNGELGEIRRTSWIITNWYRSQSYYDSSNWRATWGGEGGGVLLNQDPHQLDLLLWTTGLVPKRVRSFCSFGKMHDIEVEDDVTAYIEYTNGASGVFITSTYETPGTNRFEISGDMGKIVIENDILTFYKNDISEREFNKNWDKGFGAPNFETNIVSVSEINPQHNGILQNFSDAILNQTDLIARGEDGIKGLELSNSFHLSTWTDNWVNFPVDENLFYEILKEKVKNSKVKQFKENVLLDVSNTH